jgi:hypothetical protein
MSRMTLNRISGIVVLVTAAATISFNVLLWTGFIPRTWEYPGYLTLQTMFLFTLVAILIHHVERPGLLLLSGFTLATVDLVFGLGFSYYASFVFPVIRAHSPDVVRAVLSGPVGTLSMITMAIGILGNILFYSGVLRARLVPRWSAAVVIFSQVLAVAMLPYNIPVIVACAGLLGIGYAMLNKQQEIVPQFQAQAAN